jgi:hypothetical protein
MAEPSLSCAGAAAEAYRFTWLRTFHFPIAFRVAVGAESVELLSIQLGGAGGYEPGRLVGRSRRNLSPEEWRLLQDALARANFWKAPSLERAAGTDGAQWIFEGRTGSTYHVVDRWSPTSGPFRSLGLLFVALSRLSIPVEEVY